MTIKRVWRSVVYIYDRFFDDGCPHLGASLTYSTLLTLVPLMMLVFGILAFFPVFHGIGEKIQQFVIDNFVAASANVISEYLRQFVSQLQQLDWVNFSVLMFVSILMIYNMVHAFNQIWHTHMERSVAWYFFIYLVVLLVAPILFGLLVVVTSYIASLPLIERLTDRKVIHTPMVIFMPFLVTFVTFTFFNKVLPSCYVRTRYAVYAGLISTVMFQAAKFLFVLYLSYVPTYRLIYGALSTVPIFLMWIFLSWEIILFGGLLCHIMQHGIPDNT